MTTQELSVRSQGSPRPWLPVLVGGVGAAGLALSVSGLLLAAPGRFGTVLLAGAGALLLVALGLRSPVLACVYLLLATFFRLAIPSGTLPVDPFLIAYAGVVAATSLWLWPRRGRLMAVEVDPLACAIVLYLGWNVMSMVLPHQYAAGAPLDDKPFSVSRFVIIGTVMPLTMFLVGRWLFVSERAVRVLLWSLVAAAGYSALVSILQFSAPALVWPAYITQNTQWPDRAVGVFNQPVVNGLVLILGFLAAVLIGSNAAESRSRRLLAGSVAAASVYGVYLTHTRAVWLSFGLVVLMGALVGRGFRRGFVVTLVAMVLGVASTWSTFTSSDRSAGGVGSVDEVQDRLNTIATSLWAFERAPWTGWGIGRFPAVNTYHHQAYSPEIPWERGYGIPSHFDALGILVELGLVGLTFWMVALVLIYVRLVRATRSLPDRGIYGRALGVTALMCLVAQTTTGFTVDLRFFDFPNIAVMLVAGAAIGRSQRQVAEVEPRRAASVAQVSGLRTGGAVPR